MKILPIQKNKFTYLKTSFLLVLCIICCTLDAQQKIGPEIYLIRFTDKNQNAFSLENYSQFLSAKAIERRTKQSIPLSQNDLPVSQYYIDSIASLGFELINVSKWLNAVSVRVQDTLLFKKLPGITFIRHYSKSNQSAAIDTKYKTKQPDEIPSKTKSLSVDYGSSLTQIKMHNGDYLHKKGFEGQGITIAVLDAGFNSVKNFISLENLWFEHRVLQTRDFADKTGSTFYNSLHGSNVLSIMAGYYQETLIGTAPKANYLLIHTENTSLELTGQPYEYPVEEFDWVVAAEFADSIGADIINSSLGYNNFNDPTLSYSYEQMDGHTALSSIGAKIAASKGIIVVTSAGNEGSSFWKYITAPADADSILAVGAINSYGDHAYFSSCGPTADNRIKPDIVAIGSGSVLQIEQNLFGRANGTSFSAPIISGLAACLWQAAPDASNIQVINAIKQSASQYTNPDTVLGYGIPDFRKALFLLNPSIFETNEKLLAYPNPFTSTFTIEFAPLFTTTALFQIHDLLGRKVYETSFIVDPDYPGEFLISSLTDLPKGIYILSVITGNTKLKTNILKL